MWQQVLGIQSNATLKDVKRAYSKLIKAAYQSDDQEEIIRIQNAYQTACEYIKLQSESDKEVFRPSVDVRKKNPVFRYEECESPNNIDDFKKENIYNAYEEDIESNNIEDIESKNIEDIESKNIEDIESKRIEDIESKNIDDTKSKEIENIKWEDFENRELDDDYIYVEVQSDLDNCKAKIDPIYTDMTKRFDIEEWKEFFDSFSFNDEEYFQKHSYEYFNKYYQLPHDIWLVIEENLKLSSSPTFKWKEKITFDDKLEYYSYEEYSYEELEKLFTLRNEACEAYMNLDYESCLIICEEANKINSKEPVIIKLKGLCNFELGNYKLSYCNFEELQAYDEYKVEAKRYMADIHLKKNEFKKAISLFKEITTEDIRALNNKGQIKCLKGENKRLRAYFDQMMHLFGYDCDKLLKYEFTSKIERFLLKNNFFKINGFFNTFLFLIKLFLFAMIGLIIIAILLGITFGLIYVFYKILIGAFVIYLIGRKKKKGGK